MKVARLSAVSSGHLYRQEISLVLISVTRPSQLHSQSAAGRIMSMKKSKAKLISNGMTFISDFHEIPSDGSALLEWIHT
jgi:hypothetical protein